jgi:hypothetical protein
MVDPPVRSVTFGPATAVLAFAEATGGGGGDRNVAANGTGEVHTESREECLTWVPLQLNSRIEAFCIVSIAS